LELMELTRIGIGIDLELTGIDRDWPELTWNGQTWNKSKWIIKNYFEYLFKSRCVFSTVFWHPLSRLTIVYHSICVLLVIFR
jgi:hypothetical protein